MDSVERDDVIHALRQTFLFYGKELDKVQVGFWMRALQGQSVPSIERALAEYPIGGRFAPKPVDILEIIDVNKQREAARQPHVERAFKQCPREIAEAWMWFIAVITEDSKNLDGLFEAARDVPAEKQDQYLAIVNREAKRTNTPEAIPEDYRLPEVWA